MYWSVWCLLHNHILWTEHILFHVLVPNMGHVVDASLERPPPTAPRNKQKDYDPHLVVTCPEIEHIAWLKIAHFRTALLLCVAGLWVLLCVFPAMVQQQHDSREKEHPWDNEKIHTPRVLWLNNTQRTSMEFNIIYSNDQCKQAVTRSVSFCMCASWWTGVPERDSIPSK